MEHHTLTVEKTARGGRVRVLSGMDDGHPFRVQVPLRCKSVEDALAWLRPDGVPEDAPRQGELFFVPMGDGWMPSSLAEFSETPAGSTRIVNVDDGPWAFDRHHVERGDLPENYALTRVAQASGDTCFLGRRKVKSHGWVGRPRYFVRGQITHPEHGTLALGRRWHEVIRNRAFGPWPVRGLGAGD